MIQLRETCRVISPEDEFVRVDKRRFFTLLTNCLLGDRAGESFISARVALLDFVSVMSTGSCEAFRATERTRDESVSLCPLAVGWNGTS